MSKESTGNDTERKRQSVEGIKLGKGQNSRRGGQRRERMKWGRGMKVHVGRSGEIEILITESLGKMKQKDPARWTKETARKIETDQIPTDNF